jgi:hypothetical protein
MLKVLKEAMESRVITSLTEEQRTLEQKEHKVKCLKKQPSTYLPAGNMFTGTRTDLLNILFYTKN